MDLNLEKRLENYFSSHFLETKKRIIKKQYHKYGLVNFFTFERFLTLVKEAIDPVSENAFYIEKDGDSGQCDAILTKAIVEFLYKKRTAFGRSVLAPICPGCLSLRKITPVEVHKKVYKCKSCESALNEKTGGVELNLRKTFSFYYNAGVCCPGCNNFVPYQMSMADKLCCPYKNCLTLFDRKVAKKSKHPERKLTTSINVFDYDEVCGKKSKEELFRNHQELKIREFIASEINRLSYGNFTSIFRSKMAEAFLAMLDNNKEAMLCYLLDKSRSEKIQHKIFQQYVSIIERSFPLISRKNRKRIVMDSLLDENMGLFQGISEFCACVDGFEIKNQTKETYCVKSQRAPFYIGKLLDVIDADNGNSILSEVDSYTFFKVKIKQGCNSKNVIVKHLNIYPHYQMGHMVYLNNLRKSICDNLDSSS